MKNWSIPFDFVPDNDRSASPNQTIPLLVQKQGRFAHNFRTGSNQE